MVIYINLNFEYISLHAVGHFVSHFFMISFPYHNTFLTYLNKKVLNHINEKSFFYYMCMFCFFSYVPYYLDDRRRGSLFHFYRDQFSKYY